MKLVTTSISLALVLIGAAGTLVAAGDRKPDQLPAKWLKRPISLLNEAGRMTTGIRPGAPDRWRKELHVGGNAVRSTQLHIWLAELGMTKAQDPIQAAWHLEEALKISPEKSQLHGLAAFDRALVREMSGEYYASVDAFDELLKSKLVGFDRRTAALWYRHAKSCAGYHQQREALGITEPLVADPYCAVASLAVCLKSFNMPYAKQQVARSCRVTGYGSSADDIRSACEKLGLSSHFVNADDEGLKMLPKPLIAFVEQDHFVAVTGADKNGVTYLCSDCGPWPGGANHLTWKQWHAMDAGIFTVVIKSNSTEDLALSYLGRHKKLTGLLAYGGSHYGAKQIQAVLEGGNMW